MLTGLDRTVAYELVVATWLQLDVHLPLAFGCRGGARFVHQSTYACRYKKHRTARWLLIHMALLLSAVCIAAVIGRAPMGHSMLP